MTVKDGYRKRLRQRQVSRAKLVVVPPTQPATEPGGETVASFR